MEKKRSVGITVFAALFFVIGITLPLNFIFYNYSPLYKIIDRDILHYIVDRNLRLLPAYRIISGLSQNLILVIIAIPLLVCGLGLFFLKSWSRRISLLLACPLLIISFPFIAYDVIDIEWGLIDKPSFDLLFDPMHIHVTLITFILTIGAAAVIVYFFTRPKVKGQFK